MIIFQIPLLVKVRVHWECWVAWCRCICCLCVRKRFYLCVCLYVASGFVCIQYIGCKSFHLSPSLFLNIGFIFTCKHTWACFLFYMLTIFSGTVVQWLAGSVSIHQQLVLCVQPPLRLRWRSYSAQRLPSPYLGRNLPAFLWLPKSQLLNDYCSVAWSLLSSA